MSGDKNKGANGYFHIRHQKRWARQKAQKIQEAMMATQCKGTTAAGKRCKLMTNDPSGYCKAHEAQAVSGKSKNHALEIGLGILAIALIVFLGWSLFFKAPDVKTETVIETVEVEKEIVVTQEIEKEVEVVVTKIVEVEKEVIVTIEVEITPQPNSTQSQGAESAPGGFWWPSDRINPEKNPVRQGETGNWEDISGQWLLPDGSTHAGVRLVDNNGQKYGLWLGTGPDGYTGPTAIDYLVPNSADRHLVIRATPEGPQTGGWWTFETPKSGASESLVPGYLVPAGGALIIWNLPEGRIDFWGGFAAPKDPNNLCEETHNQDADSGLDQWQVVCPANSGATILSDGLTWYPPQ